MRRAAKIDANQEQIVSALRAAGATVQSLAAIGNGCPDLLVGFNRKTLLMEIKDGKLETGSRSVRIGDPKMISSMSVSIISCI
jgi:Holliday junction resolvase